MPAGFPAWTAVTREARRKTRSFPKSFRGLPETGLLRDNRHPVRLAGGDGQPDADTLCFACASLVLCGAYACASLAKHPRFARFTITTPWRTRKGGQCIGSGQYCKKTAPRATASRRQKSPRLSLPISERAADPINPFYNQKLPRIRGREHSPSV